MKQMSRFLWGRLTITGCFIALSGAFLIPCPVYWKSGIAISVIGLSISQLGAYRRTCKLKRPATMGG